MARFLSTHPSRSATKTIAGYADKINVSIHAPLAECDRLNRFNRPHNASFYPRTPRGVRHFIPGSEPSEQGFYPRTPRGVRPADSLAHQAYL